MNLNPECVKAALTDYRTAPIPERLRGALRLAEVMTRGPEALLPALVPELRAAGLDVVAIEEAANVVFHFNFINRLADAFDFRRPTDGQLRRMAALLNRMSGLLGGKRETPSWTHGQDGAPRPVEVEFGRTRMFEAPGATAPELRRAVEAFAASVRGGVRPSLDVPEYIVGYLRKLATAAHTLTDEDVRGLREAGLDDDGIFELTWAGAFGAALAPLEHLFQVLHAPREAELATG